MSYEELIEKVLAGKSVNATAKQLGIPQKTLESYVKGKTFPGCAVTKRMALAAGITETAAFNAVAERELMERPKRNYLQPAMATVLGAIVSVNLFLTPTPSEAAPVVETSIGTVCIMSNRRRRSAAIRAWFERWFCTLALQPATP